jgi:hypothetical protein
MIWTCGGEGGGRLVEPWWWWWWWWWTCGILVVVRSERCIERDLTVERRSGRGLAALVVVVVAAAGGAAGRLWTFVKTVDCDVSPGSKNASLIDTIECGWRGGKVQQHACARGHVEHAEL